MAKIENFPDVPYTPNIPGYFSRMVNLYNYLTHLGFTFLGSLDNSFDPLGDSSQIPNEVGGSSNWMSFMFPSFAGEATPLTISFRVRYGRYLNTSSTRGAIVYVLGCQVSQGVAQDHSFLGISKSIGEDSSPTSSGVGATNISYQYSETDMGDFIRFSDNCLTIILGAGAGISNLAPKFKHSFMLHLERGDEGSSYKFLYTNSITSGLGQNKIGVGTYAVNFTKDSNIEVSADALQRAGGSLALTSKNIEQVSNIFFKDDEGLLDTFRKAWTVPTQGSNPIAFLSLDFTGEEKPYIQEYQQIIRPIMDTSSIIFEWE